MFKNLLQEQEKRAAIVYDDPHVLHGDIWSLQGEFDYVVITTNIGWKRVNGKTTGVMGRGIALQAAKRYPTFQEYWGLHCRQWEDRSEVAHWTSMPVIAFPTKPFNPQAPYLSWQSNSTYELCQKSMTELLELIPSLSPGRVLLPPVGCGNGGLDRNCVEHEIIFPAMQVEPRLYYVQP